MFEGGQEEINTASKLVGTGSHCAKAQLGRHDNARADGVFAFCLDSIGNPATRMPNQVRNDVGVEQIATSHRSQSHVIKRWKVVVDFRKSDV